MLADWGRRNNYIAETPTEITTGDAQFQPTAHIESDRVLTRRARLMRNCTLEFKTSERIIIRAFHLKPNT